MMEMYQYFSVLKDPRDVRGLRHELGNIIVMSIYAVLCGYTASRCKGATQYDRNRKFSPDDTFPPVRVPKHYSGRTSESPLLEVLKSFTSLDVLIPVISSFYSY